VVVTSFALARLDEKLLRSVEWQSESKSESSGIVYRGMWSQPWRRFNPWISAWGRATRRQA
jgi:hypothetical protein